MIFYDKDIQIQFVGGPWLPSRIEFNKLQALAGQVPIDDTWFVLRICGRCVSGCTRACLEHARVS